jgi:hypothetical protein
MMTRREVNTALSSGILIAASPGLRAQERGRADIRPTTGLQDFVATAAAALRLSRYWLHRSERLSVLRLGRVGNRIPRGGRLSGARASDATRRDAICHVRSDCGLSENLACRLQGRTFGRVWLTITM